MFGGDSEAEEVVNRDRKRHPGCGYSTNIESRCGTNDEEKYVCRTIKTILRSCPGEAPVSIYNKTTEGADSKISLFGDLFNGLGKKGKQVDGQIEPGELENDLHEVQREVQKSLEEMMGGAHHDLKGIFNELLKDAHRGNQFPQQQRPQLRSPSQGTPHNHSPHHGGANTRPQLPYTQEYDRLVEEAMDDFYDDKQSSSASLHRRKGTKSGNIEKI